MAEFTVVGETLLIAPECSAIPMRVRELEPIQPLYRFGKPRRHFRHVLTCRMIRPELQKCRPSMQHLAEDELQVTS